MLENYAYKFTDGSGRLIFVPTTDARKFGERLHRRILKQRWTPPGYFYHFNDGGHVAAARAHRSARR